MPGDYNLSVCEQSIPLSLPSDSSNTLYAELLEVQTDRTNGYKSRNARDVLADMRRAIADHR